MKLSLTVSESQSGYGSLLGTATGCQPALRSLSGGGSGPLDQVVLPPSQIRDELLVAYNDRLAACSSIESTDSA